MKTMKLKNFPARILVTSENDESRDDQFFTVQDNESTAVDAGQKKRAAYYDLVELVALEGVIKVTRPASRIQNKLKHK